MHFLVDAQLPPALARWLVDQGHAASHVFDLGLAQASDHLIWDQALRTDAVVLTKDEDFVVRRAIEQAGPRIVWVRFGNTTRPEILIRFAAHLPHIISALNNGEGLIEID